MRNARNTGNWTDERIADLKRLWKAGYSCSVIAAEIGGVTRNAVIGKISRLGLSGRETSTDRRPRGRGSRPHQPSQRIASFIAHPFVVIEEAPKAPDHLGLTLVELKADRSQCRFIHGDNADTPYTYCAQPVRADSSYCPFHHRIVYVRPEQRPRKPFIPARGAA